MARGVRGRRHGADLGEVLSFVTFLLVQAVSGTHGQGVSLAADAGIPQGVPANGLMLAVSALLCVGLGAVLRHTASAVATCCAVVFLPGLLNFLSAPYNARVGQFALLDAAQQVVAFHPRNGRLAPGWSLAVLLARPRRLCWPRPACAGMPRRPLLIIR